MENVTEPDVPDILSGNEIDLRIPFHQQSGIRGEQILLSLIERGAITPANVNKGAVGVSQRAPQFLFHVKHDRRRLIISTEISAGVTPLILEACPIDLGLTR